MLAASTDTRPPKPVELPPGTVMLHPDTIHVLVCTWDTAESARELERPEDYQRHRETLTELLGIIQAAGEANAASGDRLAVQTWRPCPCGAVTGK